jgi:hypothetical protein
MLRVSLGAGLDTLFDDSKTSLEPPVPDTTFSDRATAAIRRSGPSGVTAADDAVEVDPSVLTPGANTADPGVRAAILAAYDVAGHPGPADLRAHDLLRRLRRDARILDEATACVRSDTQLHPESAGAQQALLLLERARLIGLFY